LENAYFLALFLPTSLYSFPAYFFLLLSSHLVNSFYLPFLYLHTPSALFILPITLWLGKSYEKLQEVIAHIPSTPFILL
jgi:hypothetical protein